MHRSRLALAALLAFAVSASAQTVINSLPNTISVSGKYILGSNLVFTTNGAQNLITVSASNVILDLNEFFVSGPGTIPNSTNAAVFVGNVSNVTIRNGTVANVGYGIRFAAGAASINHVVENVNVTRCYRTGISFDGASKSTRVSRCTVSEIGGTTVVGVPSLGIATSSGVLVADCIINGGATNVGAISYGINGADGSFYVRNVISNFQVGIFGGKFLDNLTFNCSTAPFAGGTNATGNN